MIAAKNHTPHCVFRKGMFFDLCNSAHRIDNILALLIENVKRAFLTKELDFGKPLLYIQIIRYTNILR